MTSGVCRVGGACSHSAGTRTQALTFSLLATRQQVLV